MSRAHREETHAEALIRMRKALPSGPWQNEPDALDWTHEGISCQLRRNDVGFNWCGYARVPDGHPWFSLHYDAFYGVSAHGGITFAGAVRESDRAPSWWIGFDCNHSGDLAPAYLQWRPNHGGDVYRTFEFAKGETERLAEQIVAVGRFPTCSFELLSQLTESYFETGAAESDLSLLGFLTHTLTGALEGASR